MKIKSLFCILFLAVATPVFAQNQLFHLTAKTDCMLIGTGVALYGGYFVCDKLLKLDKAFPENAVFNKEEVNAFDRLLMFPYSKSLDVTATIVGGSVCAAGALLAFAPKNEWLTIGAMYAETFLLAYSLKCVGKLAFGRTRPYMYFDNYPAEAISKSDWNNSFPSAHTDFAFAAATFTSYTFCKYFPDNPWRFAVIGGTYALAVATGALRISSGNHYITDVLGGAAIGAACGFVVPWLHTLGFDGSSEFAIGNADATLCLAPFGLAFSMLF